MSRRRSRTRGRSGRRRYLFGVGLVVTAIIFAGVGLPSVAFSGAATDRKTTIEATSLSSNTTYVEFDTVSSITENESGQTYGTIVNHLEEQVTVKVRLADNVANYVHFESATGVSISSGGQVAEVTLDSGESITLTVTVDDGAASQINTAKFTVSGGTTDNGPTISINKRLGPDVVS